MLGSTIKQLRKNLGVTQKELGEKVGVSDKTVSAWENDTKTPRATTIYTLAKIFDKPSDELFSCININGRNEGMFINSPKAMETLNVQRIVDAYRNASEEGKAMFRKLAELYL